MECILLIMLNKDEYLKLIADISKLKQDDEKYKCPICNREFGTINGTERHIRYSHYEKRKGNPSSSYHTEKCRLGHIKQREKLKKLAKYDETYGMKGKHHTEETKKKISETKKQKIASGEIKKTYKPVIVEDLELGTIEYFKGCKLFAEKYNLNYGSVKSSLRKGTVYLKRYKIQYAATVGDNSRKLGENGETPVVDNPVGSLESEEIVLKTAND